MYKIFGIDITLAGSWNINEGYPEWFGIIPNDSTLDATPAIQKLVNANIPVKLVAGRWYLSECLFNKDNVIIRGENTGLSELTRIYPYVAGQRFIVKFGGNADFSSVTNENHDEKECKNFEISGIEFFITEGKKLVNADVSGTLQNYAAICFDWCKNGYVDISSNGWSPAIFIANCWEIHFNKIMIYGSYLDFDEYAIYFGKAYTNVAASNISQVKIENIYGESIYGHFIGNKDANIADVLINNIEVEVHAENRPDHVNMTTAETRAYIFGNIRTAPKYYMIELGGTNVTILNCDVQVHDVIISHDNINYIIGLVKTTRNLSIKTLTNDSMPRALVVGVSSNLGQLTINDVVGNIYNDGDYPASIFTDVPQVDFSSYAYYEDSANLAAATLGVTILNSNIIVNIDRIREYGPGILFDAEHYWEVTSLRQWNRNLSITETEADNVERKLLSVLGGGNKILDRKMKFKDASMLNITYIGKNYWQTTDIIILTYYKNGSAIKTDGFALPYSKKAMSHSIDLYTGDYDYCTMKINGIISIESVEVVAKPDTDADQDKVVMFPSEISSEVKTIMSNYTENDIYKQTALQYFFDKIGNIKNKLNHLILPIFAKDINEAIYDVITGTQLLPVGGTNYLDFNNTTKRVHLSSSTDINNWMQTNYSLYEETDNFEGALAILSVADGLDNGLYGCRVGLNTATWGFFAPSTTNNTKIIGAGVVKNNNDNCYIRLGDSSPSDRLTTFTTLYADWNRYFSLFGFNIPSDNTLGTRILVSSDQQLSADEAKTLRDAVIALDNKYFA